MADFFSGLQAARQQGMGDLQQAAAFQGLQAQKIQSDKAQRIMDIQSGYLGGSESEQRASEAEMMAYDPAASEAMRGGRVERTQESLNNVALYARKVQDALGTPEEAQAMLGLAQYAQEQGFSEDDVRMGLMEYSQNPASAPNILQGIMDQAAGAQEVLKGERQERLAGIKAGLGTRSQKVANLKTDYPNLSTREINDIVDGRLKVTSDPLSGQVTLTNLATGDTTISGAPVGPGPAPGAEITALEGEPGTIGVPPVATPPGQPTETLFDVVGEGVGLVPVIKEGMATTLGQISPDYTFPETTKVRTKIKGVREALVSALAKSGKPPLAEQQRLLDLLPSTGIFESPEHARAQLEELHGLLSRQIMEDIAVSQDPSMAKKVRQDSAVRAQETKNVLRELGSPKPAEEIVTITTQEEYDALPSGATYTDSESGQQGRKP